MHLMFIFQERDLVGLVQKLDEVNERFRKKFTGFLAGDGNRSFQRKRRGSSEQWIPPDHRMKIEGRREKRAGPASLQIRHPCSRLKKRAKRVVDSEQVGIFPNQGPAQKHSKTGRGQTTRRNQETPCLCGGSTGQQSTEHPARHGTWKETAAAETDILILDSAAWKKERLRGSRGSQGGRAP